MSEQDELAGQLQLMLNKAVRSLEAARTLFREDDYDFASSRAYYAVFYAIQAVLLTKNVSASKHAGTIRLFKFDRFCKRVIILLLRVKYQDKTHPIYFKGPFFMGKADISGKKAINIYNLAWAEWVLQQQQIEVEAELSGEFQFLDRATDSLLQVKGAEGRFLVLTELQFRYNEDMPDRLTAYAALARRKYKQPVFVTVVYLFPPPAGVVIEKAFHQEWLGQTAHQDFQVIALWELDAEQALTFDNPALLPFAPLMRGGDTERIVRRCAARIRQEANETELEAILSVFAGYVLDTDLVKRILRWEMTIIKESPIIQELLLQERQLGFEEGRQEGRQEGHQEGRQEGEWKATLEALHQILTIRFEMGAGEFQQRLERLDLQALKQLNQAALTAQTPAAFEGALAEMLSRTASPDRSEGDESAKNEP